MLEMLKNHWIGISPMDTVVHYGGHYESKRDLIEFFESQGCNLKGWYFFFLVVEE
jgi:hypothetical protein